jgi:hypothetical protein
MQLAAATRARTRAAAFGVVVGVAGAVLVADAELWELEPHAASATQTAPAADSPITDLIMT